VLSFSLPQTYAPTSLLGPRMKVFRPLLIAFFALVASARAADATSPIDYTQRNTPFAPATTGRTTETRAPEKNETLQDRKVEKTVIDKSKASVGERRAAVEVGETKEKTIVEKTTVPTEKRPHVASDFDHRDARITTKDEALPNTRVAKYQDSLSAASATNMARFPALGKATTGKINRFVFRKNGAEPTGVTGSAPVVPAAGGGEIKR
jgi:hypothetical protein